MAQLFTHMGSRLARTRSMQRSHLTTSLAVGYLLAGRFQAVAALVRKEVPLDRIAFQVLAETHQLEVGVGQVRRVLMGAALSGGHGGQVFPLLAAYLAAPAGGAAGRVYEYCLGHD
jgi:hypothetical protein